MIPDRFLEELQLRLDAEQVISPYVKLKRSGRMLKGLCPFHSEKSPSFFVYPENNSFYCFGCGAGGDLITFIKLAEHLDYAEAVRFLADKAGLSMPEEADDGTAERRRRMLECNREAARFYHSVLLSPEGKAGLDYLTGRGLKPETIRHFGLGFAPDAWDALKNHLRQKGYTIEEMLAAALVRRSQKGGTYDQFRRRVIYPIIDLRGTVIGFGGRALGDEKPKYLNSPDTLVFKKSRGLFAMNFAKATKEQSLLLCEGYMDAISVHQAGFTNAVATLGTALTAEQARLFAQYTNEVIIAYDSDEPGQKATQRASSLLAEAGLRVRVLTVTGAKDPDEFIKKYGAARFRELLQGSATSLEYRIARLRDRCPPTTDAGKVEFLREFCALLAKTTNPVEEDIYLTRTARELEVSKEAMAAQVAAVRRQNRRREEKKFDASLRLYTEEEPNVPRDARRGTDVRYARAEDGLLMILLRHPDQGEKIAAALSPEEFVTGTNRSIYAAVCAHIRDGRPVNLTSLSGELDAPAMSHLTHLTVLSREQSPVPAEAEELIRVLREKQNERTDRQIAAMDRRELAAYIEQIAEKKNPTRGNSHGRA